MSFPLRLSRRAFTLVELLVVIVILGILIAIAVPSFVGSRDKARDAQAQSSIMVASHNAKAAWVEQESYQNSDFLVPYLRAAEPGLAFKTTNTFVDEGPNTLFVDITDSGQTVVLCSESDSGTWFCLTENAEGALLSSSQETSSDEPQLAASLSLAKSWGPTLAEAICHLPTAAASGGVGCAGGGAGWAKESADDSEAQSEGVPEITFVTTPPLESDETTANFDWTITNSPTGVQCKVDGGSFTACSAPLALTGVSVGEHSLEVRAINGFGVGPSGGYSWTVTAPPPTVTVVTGPPATTQTTTAAFTYTTNDPSADFKCKLDSGAFTLCPLAVTYTGLSVGAHTFVMQATNGAGIGTSNTWSWTVLPAAPTVTLADTPTDHTTDTNAIFTWTTGGGPVTTTECKLDAGAYASCSTPHNLTGLSVGSHTFTVKVTNAGGSNESTPYTWTIDALPAPAVTLTGGPAEGSSSASDSGSFTWTSTNATTTQCSLDGGTFTDCTSPYSFGPLSAASHTFQVKVTNATSPSGVTTPLRTWTVQETYSQAVAANSPSHYFRLSDASCANGATISPTIGSGSGAVSGASATCGSAGALTGATGSSNNAITLAGDTTIDFSGSEGWANTGGPTYTSGTFEIWFKTNDNSAGSHFVAEKYSSFGIYFASGVLDVYTCTVNPTGCTNGVSHPVSGLADGDWHHLVVAYSTTGSTFRVWVDGVTKFNVNQPVFRTAGAPLYLGGRGFGGKSYFFDGSLDEVATYESALTDADVQAHYNARTR